MKISTLLSLILGSSSLLCAAPSGLLVLPSQAERAAVAVSLTQPADYLCAVLAIGNTEKEPSVSADGVRRTLAALTAEVAKTPALELHRGAVRASPYYGKGSSSFYSSSSPANELNAQVLILWKLDAAKPDSLAGAALTRGVVARVKPSGDTTVRIESLGLAVDSPETRRAELLKRVAVEADAMRAAVAGGAVTISGLESPVLVRQMDESRVELFIDYRLGVTK